MSDYEKDLIEMLDAKNEGHGTLAPKFAVDEWEGLPLADDELPVYRRKIKDLEWVWDGILPRGGISLIAGKPKVGKSTFVTHLISAIANGDEFFGRKTMQGRTLYIVCEGSEDEIIRKAQEITHCKPLPIFVKFTRASGPIQGTKALKGAIEQYQPIFIAVDTLWRLMWTEDADEYAQTVKSIENIELLAKDYGVHIMAIHHEKKASQGDIGDVLGSTALTAGVDTIVQLKSKDNYRQIRTTQRHGTCLAPTWIALDGIQYKKMDHLPGKREEEVKQFISENPNASIRKIMKECRIASRDAQRYKKETEE